MLFKNILVPYDESECSLRAFKIAAIAACLIGIYSTSVGFINSTWIEFFVGIGFLVAGIYLIRKFVKDRKKS